MVRSCKIGCVVTLLLVMAVRVGAQETASGKIKVADTARNEVVLKGVVKDTVYELTKDAAVWLDGMASKLSDLKADDQAVVTYRKNGDHLMASTVRAVRNAKETTGTVKNTFPDKKEVTVKGIVKDTTYEVIKGGTIWIEGKQATLKDIREGDHVLITYIQRGEHLMAQDVSVTKRK